MLSLHAAGVVDTRLSVARVLQVLAFDNKHMFCDDDDECNLDTELVFLEFAEAAVGCALVRCGLSLALVRAWGVVCVFDVEVCTVGCSNSLSLCLPFSFPFISVHALSPRAPPPIAPRPIFPRTCRRWPPSSARSQPCSPSVCTPHCPSIHPGFDGVGRWMCGIDASSATFAWHLCACHLHSQCPVVCPLVAFAFCVI